MQRHHTRRWWSDRQRPSSGQKAGLAWDVRLQFSLCCALRTIALSLKFRNSGFQFRSLGAWNPRVENNIGFHAPRGWN